MGRLAFPQENMPIDIRKMTPAAPAAPAAVARPITACSYIGVSRATLGRLARSGRLRKVQLGPRAVGFTYADLDAYLASATAV
jgi:excisionase family DNA binding protein